MNKKRCYCCLLEMSSNEFYNKQTTCTECFKKNHLSELWTRTICNITIRKRCKKDHEYSNRHLRSKITGESYEKGLQWHNMRRSECINFSS